MALHDSIDNSDILSIDSNKHLLDVPVSPTESELPELLKATVPIAEHNKPSPIDRRYPSVIPPKHSNRTLVLCFDGTGDEFDADNSNVVLLASLLKKDDITKQLVYYQSGVGTYSANGDPTGIIASIRKILDEMFAWSIDTHIIDGYRFLMENYTEGDKICIFGFSRGAYTARSLAGMLHKVGLIPRGNIQQISFAYKMYTRADKYGWDQSYEFKSAFSMDVPIEFIGVWDTVSSIGGIRGRTLPVATASTNARTFRQALALDERRVKFQAHHWKEEQIDLVNHSEATYHTKTDVQEVWFAGCHCDVGGGSVSNKTRNSLARIPLRWMIRECFKTNTGIMFNTQSFASVGLDPSTLYPFVTPRPPALPVGPGLCIRDMPATPIPINILALSKKKESHPDLLKESGSEDAFGTEEEEDLKDTLSPIYDQLSLEKYWWIGEIIPYLHTHQHDKGNWVRYFWPHLGRGRVIPRQTPGQLNVHRSVSSRMIAVYENERARKKGEKYTPKPHFHVEPTWVD